MQVHKLPSFKIHFKTMSDKGYVDDEVDETWQSFLEQEISELLSLHEAHADDLQEAFSPTVRNLLLALSEDDAVYHHQTSDESASSSSKITSEDTETRRMTFRFIYEEFMTAPKDQRMGAIHTFLDRLWETANRVILSGEASMSWDRNVRLRRCVTAVKTMKEVLGSKFANIQKYLKTQIENIHESLASDDAPGSHQGLIRQGGVPLVPPRPQGRSGRPILPGLDICKSGVPLLPGLDIDERGCPIIPGAQYGKSSNPNTPDDLSETGYPSEPGQEGLIDESGGVPVTSESTLRANPSSVPQVDPTTCDTIKLSK
ncbi:hypothetical protein JTE90_021843 [Oedothorax gibbosus]|uniref:Uncharacterized protein n=1 Tax=Oedothorax gibbosus TaxID=931172 RepID=A0AAV6UZV3_9ARAC|nr:hypothetical protein JTE90_021843 [Oedothorax gibbosus]